MPSTKFLAAFLLLLCPMAANAGGEAAMPDAPSSSMPVNSMLRVTVPPGSYRVRPPFLELSRVVDKQFLILSAISTATIFADSYTTTWIGKNYRAHGGGPCSVEGGEPLLYGLHPTVGRSYAVGAAMATGAIVTSYFAKKHLPSKLKWMWATPMVYETAVSVNGFTTNLARCN